MKCIAVIPARGGSKRIPRKNIKPFCGKPLIAYSIEAAIASKLFAKIVVSTDDQEIASVAKQYGADVPFIRPATLSDDYAATLPVVAHALEQEMTQTKEITHCCCIYATAPLIQVNHLKAVQQLLVDRQADYAFPVTEFDFPILRAVSMNEDNILTPSFEQHINARSQDLPDYYHDCGQFYWGKVSSFLNHTPIISKAALGYPIPRRFVQDIDTPDDWLEAELKYHALNSGLSTDNS
ncbi:pseudaminic acid cytidylyltransferase [Corallincola spongiicola]|uniref:pseudaminic acid cytidylyltransferase n=1 Tax=Corallincola spongiicola TaxID=2520508 RepID=UPI001FE952C7|nr:pseudaminic acid cytidylyltransferase [Corallincola spongiicola]